MMVPLWAIPTGITVAGLVLMAAWPLPAQHGDYDFGPPIAAALRLTGWAFVSLLSWTVYFALT